jgi:hypothetical protein
MMGEMCTCTTEMSRWSRRAVVRVKTICPGGARPSGNVPPRCRSTVWNLNRSVYWRSSEKATLHSAPVAFHKIFDGRIIGRRRFVYFFSLLSFGEYNIVPQNTAGPFSLILFFMFNVPSLRRLGCNCIETFKYRILLVAEIVSAIRKELLFRRFNL